MQAQHNSTSSAATSVTTEDAEDEDEDDEEDGEAESRWTNGSPVKDREEMEEVNAENGTRIWPKRPRFEVVRDQETRHGRQARLTSLTFYWYLFFICGQVRLYLCAHFRIFIQH